MAAATLIVLVIADDVDEGGLRAWTPSPQASGAPSVTIPYGEWNNELVDWGELEEVVSGFTDIKGKAPLVEHLNFLCSQIFREDNIGVYFVALCPDLLIDPSTYTQCKLKKKNRQLKTCMEETEDII